MKSVFLVFALLLWQSFTPARSQSVHIGHCLAGCPEGVAGSNELVVRNLFAASLNAQTGLADWVAYRVLAGTIGVASLLPRDWQEDSLAGSGLRRAEDGAGARLSQPILENAQDQAYRLTEFTANAGDQGRLVPMSSFANSGYWQDLNYLSVMALLVAEVRLGSWARLDQAVNRLAQQHGEVFVLSGPLYAYQSSRDQSSSPGASLPVAYFKVVAVADGRVAAFVFDQQLPSHAAYCNQSVALEQIEALSGLNFFPQSRDWPLGSLDDLFGCATGGVNQ